MVMQLILPTLKDFVHSWWPTAIAWLAVTTDIASVIWEAADGQIDLLWVTIITLAVVIICWLLVLKQLSPSMFPLDNAEHRDSLTLQLPQEELDRRRRAGQLTRLLASLGPAIVTTVVFVVLICAGGAQILAPARCISTDGTYCALIDGEVRRLKNQSDGARSLDIRVGIAIPKLLKHTSPYELADLTSSGLGLKFRLERAPNVYKCEIVKVAVTVLDVDPLEPIEPGPSPAAPPPLLWVVQFPKGARRGDVVEAKLVKTDDEGARFDDSIPGLPVGASQPSILRFTSQERGLFKVRVDVFLDSGWRSWLSGPVKVCDGIGIPIYDREEVMGSTGGPPIPAAPEAVPPAPAAPAGPAPST
jgi:hypothetical protein